jgi:hypothetical protein
MTRLTTLDPRLGRHVARLAVASAVALVALVPVAGCSGTPPGEFIILQNQVPNDDCSIPAGLSSVYRSTGTLDVSLIQFNIESPGYFLFPVMQNNFPPPAGQTLDANRIALSSFNVDVDVPAVAPAADDPTHAIWQMISDARASADPKVLGLVQYNKLTSGSVSSGGGFTSSAVEVFPTELAAEIASMKILTRTQTFTALVRVRALGDTLVNPVTSDSFTFPIELCDGCLMASVGVCPVAAPSGNLCYMGQDDATGCCVLNSSFVCPSQVMSK